MKARTLDLVWLGLVLLTVGSWRLADASHVSVLLGLATLKLFLVKAWFMELLHCRPLFLRAAVAFDLLVLGLVLVAFS
jgi:hypothetical protein